MRVVGEANLGRKAPTISKLVRFPKSHYLCSLDTLSSVLINNITISSASCYLHISGSRCPSSLLYKLDPMCLLISKRASPRSLYLTTLLLPCSSLILLSNLPPLRMLSRGRWWNLRSGE